MTEHVLRKSTYYQTDVVRIQSEIADLVEPMAHAAMMAKKYQDEQIEMVNRMSKLNDEEQIFLFRHTNPFEIYAD